MTTNDQPGTYWQDRKRRMQNEYGYRWRGALRSSPRQPHRFQQPVRRRWANPRR